MKNRLGRLFATKWREEQVFSKLKQRRRKRRRTSRTKIRRNTKIITQIHRRSARYQSIFQLSEVPSESKHHPEAIQHPQPHPRRFQRHHEAHQGRRNPSQRRIKRRGEQRARYPTKAAILLTNTAQREIYLLTIQNRSDSRVSGDRITHLRGLFDENRHQKERYSR